MGKINAQQNWVHLDNGITLNTFCWNPDDIDKPPVLLIHGTGFVAACFDQTAQQLKEHFRVYAYDRRGHGWSSKPETGYQFEDFADDLYLFCQQMKLPSLYGIGHSAGATDLLVAESLWPGMFSKLLIMEPTITDPEQQLLPPERAVMNMQSRIEQAKKRRSHFESHDHVYENYRHKPLFSTWTEFALKTYIHYGFKTIESKETNNTGVELQCSPEIESEILRSIFLAFSNASITGKDDINAFGMMDKVRCDMLITQSEQSITQFKGLCQRAQKHFPFAKVFEFAGVGHCVPQEDPEALARVAISFWLNE